MIRRLNLPLCSKAGGQGDSAISKKERLMSNAFQVFMKETPQHAKPWLTAAQNLGDASALDKKTGSLAYLAVLSVLRLESGIPFHEALAKEAGASRNEVISAILVGLLAAGNVVTRAFARCHSCLRLTQGLTMKASK